LRSKLAYRLLRFSKVLWLEILFFSFFQENVDEGEPAKYTARELPDLTDSYKQFMRKVIIQNAVWYHIYYFCSTKYA